MICFSPAHFWERAFGQFPLPWRSRGLWQHAGRAIVGNRSPSGLGREIDASLVRGAEELPRWPGLATRPRNSWSGPQEEMAGFRRLVMDAGAAKPCLVRGERAASQRNDCRCSPLALLIVLL